MDGLRRDEKTMAGSPRQINRSDAKMRLANEIGDVLLGPACSHASTEVAS